MDNKQSIYFDEGKTKSILLASKCKWGNVKKLNIKYGGYADQTNF